MRWTTYLPPVLLFVPAAASVMAHGAWTWFVPAFTFGLLPLLDRAAWASEDNLDADGEAHAAADPRYDALLLAVVVGQLGLLALFLTRIHAGGLTPVELSGLVATMGVGCGVYGINVGHELGHRRERWAQRAAQTLLLTSLYMHFFIEHNRGHHRRVATPDDPASARLGETVYTFWLRSVVGSFADAWVLERDRLAANGRGPWSTDNQLLQFVAVELAAIGVVGAMFGTTALAAWCVAAGLGALLLETVNYVEHYGLQRQRTAQGAWERVRPEHSWNSNRPMGRVFLFELTRHSDHHAHATRPFAVLRHHDEAPELPHGYPAMVLAALVPPLFFAVMHPALDGWRARQQAHAAA
jgi:alkane 1-monooxygenase